MFETQKVGRHDKFRKEWSQLEQMQVPNGTGPGVRRSDLLCRCSQHVEHMQTGGVKQNRSTEGCSRLKRSVDMTSSGKNGLNIRTNASPKWDRTRCPEE